MAPTPADEIGPLMRQARADGGPALIGRVIRGSKVTAVILADRSGWVKRALEMRKRQLLSFLQDHNIQADQVAIIDQFKDPLVEYAVLNLGARVTYREDE